MSSCGVEPRAGRHQKTVAAIAAALCRPARNRGVLVWHSVGSGKTGSSVAAMDAVWDVKRRRRPLKIVYVSSVEGLASNPPETFHAFAALLPRFAGRGSEDIAAAFARRGVEFLSFAQLAHVLQLYRPRRADSAEHERAMRHHLADALVVVDEAHTLMTPLPGQAKECEALTAFLRTADDSRTAGMRVMLLTATPGDSVRDVMTLLDVARGPAAAPLSEADLADDPGKVSRRLRGIVSFFDYSADLTRFPRVRSSAHAARMSLDQALELGKKGAAIVDGGQDRAALRKMWLPARRYSNTLFQWPAGAPMATFSGKLAALLDVVRRHPGEKHLVYSAFCERRGYGGHGARAIVRALVEFEGYAEALSSDPGRRVALVARGQPVERIKRHFNAASNARGESLQVLVVTQGFNQALDLKGVRHIHVFEPLTSMEDEKQLVGRGSRMCSHAQLEYPHEWTVTVHRYRSTPPDVSTLVKESSDHLIAAKAHVSAIADEQAVLKGVRGSGAVTARRAFLKRAITRAKGDIKAEAASAKRLAAVDAVDDVDAQVYGVAKLRDDKVGVLLALMRDAAIDCEVYRTMHGRAGIEVRCGSGGTE